MAAQAALISETIVGMKKALRRESDHTGPDDLITQPTNRGNKLRQNARYVHEGVLGFSQPQDMYREKIDHAGYSRYILKRNPTRYDSEGDEIDEDETNSEVEAAAAEDNPFADIALERILCPIRHPSELPDHPALAYAYRSKALRTMTEAVEEKLRKERVLLWRARNLHRQFLGDSSWMPCGKVETTEDKFIFEPQAAAASLSVGSQLQGDTELSASGNNQKGTSESSAIGHTNHNETNIETEREGQGAEPDVDMPDAPQTDVRPGPDTKKPNEEDEDASVKSLLQQGANGNPESNSKETELVTQPSNLNESPNDDKGQLTAAIDARRGNTANLSGDMDIENEEIEKNPDGDNAGSSPEPPRRMTTRAQANATIQQQENGFSGQSTPHPTDGTDSIPSPHPLFLAPDSIRPNPDFGLPAAEAEETRRLLWSYIQKQDETVRGFEYMLDQLLRACRMKDDVFEWCKAEGHVGELSDGEDWYDREKWGLAADEDLKKGADEEDAENVVDEGRTTGKRGRGRRQ